MPLDQLRINNLRNITGVDIAPASTVNLIHGANGSGKSSLLEAIYLLGRGRSFRESNLNSVIRRGTEELHLFGLSTEQGIQRRIGLRKGKHSYEISLDGHRLKRLSTLVMELPVHVITPQSHLILEGGSGNRRRFIDWGVFHVEQQFQQLARRYQRVLSQRNSALKQQPLETGIWDRELVENAHHLEKMRADYINILRDCFLLEQKKLLPGIDIELEWRRGWPDGRALEQVLSDGLATDKKRGYTHYGAHRGDLHLKIDGVPVTRWSSRGQQKLVITALVLAQTRAIQQRGARAPILLIDDFSSELDDVNQGRIRERVLELGCQAFITVISADDRSRSDADALFHVEHGEVFQEGV